MADKLVPIKKAPRADNEPVVLDPTVDFTLGNPSLEDLVGPEGPASTTPEPRIDAIADYVQSKYKVWRDARSSLESKWLEWYRMWRCIPDAQDKTKNSERSTLKMPATKEAVTNFVSSMMQTIFATDPFFDLQPNHFDNERPGHLRQYMRWIMDREKFKAKAKLFVTEEGIYGTAFGRIRSFTETKQRVVTSTTMRPQLNPFTMQEEQVEETTRERQETDYIRPYFEPVSIYNLFAPPQATGVQPGEAEGVIIRSRHTNASVAQMRDRGVIEIMPEEDATGSPNDSTDTLRTRLQYSGITSSSAEETDPIEILEYFGWIPPEVLKEAGMLNVPGGGESEEPSPYEGRELMVIVSGGKVLNPSSLEPPFGITERPIVMDRFEQVAGEFYGMGICEMASGPQKALNATVRSRIDNKALAINQVFGADRRKLTSGQDLGLYPGKVILCETNPKDVLVPFVIPDVTSGSYQEAADYERYIRSAHGISELIGGKQMRGEQTATEISSLLGQSMSIIRTIAESFETNVLKPTLCWYARIIQEFPNKQEIIHIIDQNGLPKMLQIESPDLMGDYDFTPLGLATMAMRDKVGKTMNFLQMTANPMDGPITNRAYLLKQVWKGLGFDDADVVIANPQQAQEQAAAQALPPAIAGIMGGEAPAVGAASTPAPLTQSGGTQPSEILPMSAPGGTPNA